MSRRSSLTLILFCCIIGAFAQDLSKIRFAENTLVRDLDDLYWLDEDVALLLTDGGRVFRSADSGFSWNEITSQLESSSTSTPAFLYPSTIDAERVYIRGDGSVSWISRDKGATWQAVRPKASYRNLDWHPINPEWAIAWVTSNDVYGDLYVTTDFTLTWKLVKNNVYQYFWGDAGKGKVPQDRIYMITKGESFRNLVQTDDYGKTVETLQSNAYAAVWMQNHLFVAVALLTAQKSVLKVSPHVGLVYKKFAEAEFPFGDELDNNGYVLLDDSTGGVYIGVNHGDRQRAKWGNVYISGSQGYEFTTSLQHVAMSASDNLFDFDRVFGVEGVFLANVLINYQENNAKTDRITTLLTTNNGKSWNPIQRPVKDINGDPYICTGPCTLQLHGWNSLDDYFGPFYSTDRAVGLVISTGNVGEYLSFAPSEINTYLSRDAGLTWKEIIRGSTIYEIGDHGNIVVFAPYGQPTNKLYYTLDQATTPLKSIEFSKTNITVYNIQHEPGNTNTRFVLTGRRGRFEDVVIGIDFSQIYSSTCVVDNDYETFMLSNGRTNIDGLSCLLGRQVTYRRKKPSSQCFSPDNLVTEKSRVNCSCTDDDFDCDFNWTDVNGVCKLLDASKSPQYPPDYCPPGFQYYKTTGYRKEAGNTCKGGQESLFAPVGPFDCPGSEDVTGHHKSKGWIAAVVILLFVALALGGAAVALRNDKIRERLPEIPWLQNWKNGYFKFGSGNGRPDTLLDDDEDLFLPRDQDEELGGNGNIPAGQEFSDFSGSSSNSAAAEAMNANLIDDDPFDPRK